MFRGTVIAQIIAVFGAVFLAKIYGEEAYGVLGVFISIISITSIISTLQLDNCIVISKNEIESSSWFSFLLLFSPIILIVVFVFLLISTNYISYNNLNSNLIILAFIAGLFYSCNIIHEHFLTFKKQFSVLSNAKVFLTICNVLLQIIFYTFFKLLGLLIGYLISQFILVVFYFIYNRKNIIKFNLNKIKVGVKSNSRIVKFLLPSNIINSLANHLMPILILAFFGAKEAGVYFFSIKILGTPLFLISSSVSKVFFQKSSELLNNNKKELLKTTKKIVKTNLYIMFFFLVIINTIGMYILEVYFGENWETLRSYTLILSILILARTAFNPISSLIVVLDKNFESLIFNIYLFVINLLAIYFGYSSNNLIITILILAIFGGIGYLALLTHFLTHLKIISKK